MRTKEQHIERFLDAKSVTEGPRHYFFGYYDKCPWDSSGRYMLSLGVDFIDRLPKADDVATIYLVDTERGNEMKEIASTSAWNFQQGCMLQWLGPDFKEKIIYNDRENGKYVSIILNVFTGERKIIPFPVYSVSPKGDRAVSANFSRIDHLRESYGYAGIPDKGKDTAVPKDDGVYTVDLNTGEWKLAISLQDLYGLNSLSTMDSGKHWVDHLMFNTDGTRFCFLHRWEIGGGALYIRLYTADADGGNLYCLLDSGNFSHFGWRTSKELLGWGKVPNAVNSMRRNKWLTKYILPLALPIYRMLVPDRGSLRRRIVSDAYLLMKDNTHELQKVAPELLDDDGHCTFSPDGKWILTDKYPINQKRTLILYDYDKGVRIDIGLFHSLPDKKYCEKYNLTYDWDVSGMRADLHPRWNRDGTKVCVDSVHEGKRKMYVMDVSSVVSNSERR